MSKLSGKQYQYRVMFRHYDGTICEYATDISKETAQKYVDSLNGERGDREFWIEQRAVCPWSRST